jgi:hypothetical protein
MCLLALKAFQFSTLGQQWGNHLPYPAPVDEYIRATIFRVKKK